MYNDDFNSGILVQVQNGNNVTLFLLNVRMPNSMPQRIKVMTYICVKNGFLYNDENFSDM